MDIKENFSLKHYNTFGIESIAGYYVNLSTLDEILEFLTISRFKNIHKLILGGGSNILFTKNFDGIVLKIDLKGKEVIKEDKEFRYIRVGAGENWHEFILFCIKNNYPGVENLSLIPGNAGAAPIQNIGAYGVELESVFAELEAVNILNGDVEVFSNTDCKFGYRKSVFKNELKDQYIISSIIFKLSKEPVFNTSYSALQQELENMDVEKLSIKAISEAVCNIRKSKLPDPVKIGNAGSFFKNPVVSNEKFEVLKSKYPDIISYEDTETGVKLAAAWLIDWCGWKGKTFGEYGVHKNHALVLVNYGNAKGRNIYELSEKIIRSVKDTFGVVLEREVNVI
ncbi:MAG: UDP-N-acetylmuramate dehydrogenase [Bacteroidota bacterium]